MRVLVLGWYHHNNLGDELFKEAFKVLWPQVSFNFVNSVPCNINEYDALFIGGGSILDNKINLKNCSIPVGVIGVGFKSLEITKDILDSAKLVIVRDRKSQGLYSKSLLGPDLVFSLPCSKIHKPSTRVSIILNDFTSPKHNGPEWKTLAHFWFVSEFSKTCNFLIKEGYVLDFIPMCIGDIDDRRIAGQLISRIDQPSKVNWVLEPQSLESLENYISNSAFTMTQRLHGAIISTRVGAPFISFNLHDKFKTFTNDIGWKYDLEYYGYRHDDFVKKYDSVLKEDTKQLVDVSKKYLGDWKCLSDIVTKTFSL